MTDLVLEADDQYLIVLEKGRFLLILQIMVGSHWFIMEVHVTLNGETDGSYWFAATDVRSHWFIWKTIEVVRHMIG